MNRRELMTALPFAALAGTVPAQGVTMEVIPSTETPVMAMFREWRAHSAWLNGPAAAECSDSQFEAQCTENVNMIERMVGAPCRDAGDLCLKLLALSDFGEFIQFPGIATRDQLAVDVRALIGG